MAYHIFGNHNPKNLPCFWVVIQKICLIFGLMMFFNYYAGDYSRIYFWRTSDKQEIDYVEERDGRFKAFEMKSNPKRAKASIPATFLKSYDVEETNIITPDNYLDFLC